MRWILDTDSQRWRLSGWLLGLTDVRQRVARDQLGRRNQANYDLRVILRVAAKSAA